LSLSTMLDFRYMYIKTGLLYSRTSPQRPRWGLRKVAVVERWLLWGGGGVI